MWRWEEGGSEAIHVHDHPAAAVHVHVIHVFQVVHVSILCMDNGPMFCMDILPPLEHNALMPSLIFADCHEYRDFCGALLVPLLVRSGRS